MRFFHVQEVGYKYHVSQLFNLGLNKNTILTQQLSSNLIPFQLQTPQLQVLILYVPPAGVSSHFPGSRALETVVVALEDKCHNNELHQFSCFPLVPSPKPAHPKPTREGGCRRVSVSPATTKHWCVSNFPAAKAKHSTVCCCGEN